MWNSNRKEKKKWRLLLFSPMFSFKWLQAEGSTTFGRLTANFLFNAINCSQGNTALTPEPTDCSLMWLAEGLWARSSHPPEPFEVNNGAAAEPRGPEDDETPMEVKMRIVSMVARRSGWSRMGGAPSSLGGRHVVGPLARQSMKRVFDL